MFALQHLIYMYGHIISTNGHSMNEPDLNSTQTETHPQTDTNPQTETEPQTDNKASVLKSYIYRYLKKFYEIWDNMK